MHFKYTRTRRAARGRMSRVGGPVPQRRRATNRPRCRTSADPLPPHGTYPGDTPRHETSCHDPIGRGTLAGPQDDLPTTSDFRAKESPLRGSVGSFAYVRSQRQTFASIKAPQSSQLQALDRPTGNRALVRCERLRRGLDRLSPVRREGATPGRFSEEKCWVRTVRGQSDITAMDDRFLAENPASFPHNGPSKPRVAGSNPAGRTISKRSIPETWVTDHSGDIGNTFGLNGFSIGSSLHVSWSKYPRS